MEKTRITIIMRNNIYDLEEAVNTTIDRLEITYKATITSVEVRRTWLGVNIGVITFKLNEVK